MPALRERFFDRLAAAMTELREFGCTCRDFDQGAARACNGALQLLNKHPWCSKPHTLPIPFLPRFIGKLFKNDGIALPDDLMHLPAMQAFAVSRQFALFFRFSSPGLLVALALLPVALPFASQLDAALDVIVVGIGRSPLPIHFSLQPAVGLRIGGQLLTKDRQAGFSLASKQGDA